MGFVVTVYCEDGLFFRTEAIHDSRWAEMVAKELEKKFDGADFVVKTHSEFIKTELVEWE